MIIRAYDVAYTHRVCSLHVERDQTCTGKGLHALDHLTWVYYQLKAKS
jgi:hypothetical protein